MKSPFRYPGGKAKLAPLLARWRSDALAVVTDPNSAESLRAAAWRFLRQWGAR